MPQSTRAACLSPENSEPDPLAKQQSPTASKKPLIAMSYSSFAVRPAFSPTF
jgi:hypothetical protein